MESSSDFNYYITLWGVDPVFSFSTTVPQNYSIRKLVDGTADPRNGSGSFTLDDNLYQRVTGTPSLGNGIGTVSFITGRDGIVVLTVNGTSGPILPGAFTNSDGMLYTTAPAPSLWLQAIFEAILPETIGLQKQGPVAASYYQPANTQKQLCEPSLLPNIIRIMVYPGANPNTFVTYMLTAHNSFGTWVGKIASSVDSFNKKYGSF